MKYFACKGRGHQLLKKTTAVAAASVMVMTTVPVSASAQETTYSEREKEALQSLGEYLEQTWNESLEELDAGNSNGGTELTLTVDDAGKSMLGMLTQMDLSWLESVKIQLNASISDSKEAVKADILLNDTVLCTMNMLMDMLTNTEYVQIPELSESWIRAELSEVFYGEEADSAESMGDFMELLSDPSKIFPDGAVIADLLNRYGTIVMDHMQEGASVAETISIDGISEDCTLLEGQMFETDLKDAWKEILTTAQEDEQLKELLTQWSEEIPDAGDLNEQLESYVQEQLANLEDEDTEEASGEYLASRIWVNSNNEIKGREIAICEGADEEPLFTWKSSDDGDASALMFCVQSDGSEFTLSGSGQTADGMLSGNYIVSSDGVAVMEIALENYDAEAAEKGYPSGTYTITFPQSEDEEDYNYLSMFSLILDLTSDEASGSLNLNLEILSSGVSLGALNLNITENSETVEAVSEDAMGTILDTASDEDMNTYASEISLDTIFANAEKAGVPSELITALQESLESAADGEEISVEEELEEIEETVEDTEEEELVEEPEE